MWGLRSLLALDSDFLSAAFIPDEGRLGGP